MMLPENAWRLDRLVQNEGWFDNNGILIDHLPEIYKAMLSGDML